jgi:hypothetical protein
MSRSRGFKLDPNDVTSGTSGSSASRGKRGNPRIGSRRLWLRQQPPGIEVSAELPGCGRPYSKREAQEWHCAVYPELYRQLEREVAKALRISGL